MHILVTGGAGFIGSNFVHYICEVRPSWRITVLDLLTYAGNLENIRREVESGAVAFVREDIRNLRGLEKLFTTGSYDMVFHFAAESHVDRSITNPAEFVETNVVGTQNLLAVARSSGCRRFVHISTDEVYGSLGPIGRFVETTPLDPTSPYSASKASSDLLALACNKTYNQDIVVTRCTNNYGPFQFPEKFIPLFITNALCDAPLPLYGDGLNVRSWLHVRDHSEAILMVAEKGKSGEVYNIGGMEEAEKSNIDVAREILQILGKSDSLITYVKDRPAHDRRYAIDYGKIHSELDWSPSTKFEEGLRSTVKWYIDNRSWWENIKTGAYLEYYERHYGKALCKGAA